MDNCNSKIEDKKNREYKFELPKDNQSFINVTRTDYSEAGLPCYRVETKKIPIASIFAATDKQKGTRYSTALYSRPYTAQLIDNDTVLSLIYIENDKELWYRFDLQELIPKYLDPFVSCENENIIKEIPLNGFTINQTFKIENSCIRVYIGQNLVMSVDSNSFLLFLKGCGFKFSENKLSPGNPVSHLFCDIKNLERPNHKTLHMLSVLDPNTKIRTDFYLEELIPLYLDVTKAQTTLLKDQQTIKRADMPNKPAIEFDKEGIKINIDGNLDTSAKRIFINGVAVPVNKDAKIPIGAVNSINENAFQQKIKKLEEDLKKMEYAYGVMKTNNVTYNSIVSSKDIEINQLRTLSVAKDKTINEMKEKLENFEKLAKEQDEIAQKLAQNVLVNTLANRNLKKEQEKLIQANRIYADGLNDQADRLLKQTKEICEIKEKSFSNMIKKDATAAVYRVGATQMMKVLKAAILTLLQKAGKDNKTIQVISDLLASDIGVAILSCICGYSVEQLVDDNEVASKFAEELRVSGMSLAGNMAFETLFEMITSSIVPILSSVEEQTKIKVLDDKEIAEEEKLLMKAC